VQASWHEGFPYSILEAACCGVPAVATRVSGTVDAVADGRTGLLVGVKDAGALAAAITRLLTDEPLRRSLGGAARDWVRATFAADAVCPLMVEEYRRLLGSARP
jgi:glycosyltransferase involved in cell wall biosynthesis